MSKGYTEKLVLWIHTFSNTSFICAKTFLLFIFPLVLWIGLVAQEKNVSLAQPL